MTAPFSQDKALSSLHLTACVCTSCCRSAADGNNLTRSNDSLGTTWNQPGGQGSPLTLTYSFTDGFLSNIMGLTVAEAKACVEKAFEIVAQYVPINFVEKVDQGLDAATLLSNTGTRAQSDEPQLRFHNRLINGPGGTLAFAYFPSEALAIGGDMFFDQENWQSPGFFVETVIHELGHALGLQHVTGVQAIMNPSIQRRFGSLAEADLLPDDIQTLRSAYGQGTGSVAPLSDRPTPAPVPVPTPVPPPPTDNRPVIQGTNGNDRLIGNGRDQTLNGRGGDDWINGKQGNDLAYGGTGRDRILGGSGNDRLYGQADDDRLQGGTGDDRLYGQKGDDRLVGVAPNNATAGRNEKDILIGGAGTDTFVLGDRQKAFYDDGNADTLGLQDYALIKDLSMTQGDKIVLHGNRNNYVIGQADLNGRQGSAIMLDTSTSGWEVIALVEGVQTLSLTSNTFTYIS